MPDMEKSVTIYNAMGVKLVGPSGMGWGPDHNLAPGVYYQINSCKEGAQMVLLKIVEVNCGASQNLPKLGRYVFVAEGDGQMLFRREPAA